MIEKRPDSSGLRKVTGVPYSFMIDKVAEICWRADPGVLAIKEIGRSELFCKVRTCPSPITTITFDAPFEVNKSGNKENPAKQDPGTGIPSKNRERDHAGTGSGNGGVNCPSTLQVIL